MLQLFIKIRGIWVKSGKSDTVVVQFIAPVAKPGYFKWPSRDLYSDSGKSLY